MVLDIAFLCFGLVAWWLYYGLECFINGATTGGFWLPLVCWFEELSWNLPFVGQKCRLAHTRGDADWAKQLPGPVHFLLTCVLLPLGPWLVYRFWKFETTY
jgi:hypothetical protein